MTRFILIGILLTSIFALGCSESSPPETSNSPAETSNSADLSDQTIEEIVKRSYQYVAMYNVNQKMALAEEGLTTRGYNKGFRNT
ncbi:MAG: hypothetical protein D9N11_08950, partial [Ketobacter sp.]